MENQRLIQALMSRRIDPASSLQLGGQTFRPESEANQPMAFNTPLNMPANLMNPQSSVAQMPYVQGQDTLTMTPASQRQIENERYALQQQMLEQDRIRRGMETPPDPRMQGWVR